jgi:transcriptional regulator with XRE-family HTH domain
MDYFFNPRYNWNIGEVSRMGIGKMILQALEAKKMTQRELANKLRIATTTLNGYIKGWHEPDYATLKAIALILGVSTNYLLEFEPSNTLDRDEIFLVSQHRDFDEWQKELVLEQVKLISAQNEKRTKSV